MNTKKIPFLQISLFILFAVALLALSLFLQKPQEKQTESVAPPTTLPLLVLEKTDTSLIRLEDLVGTPLLVVSWATWSPFSNQALAIVSEITQGSATRVIAINRAEPLSLVRSYEENLPYKDIVYLVDVDDSFFKETQGYDVPEFLLYDKNGSLKHHVHGIQTKEYLQTLLNDIQK